MIARRYTYAQHERSIRINLLRRKREVLTDGGEWPRWIVVVRGDHSKVSFPALPDDFDIWFDDWARTNNITIVQDWRAEARQDGCADDWIWQEAHKIAADMRAILAEGGARG